MVEMIIVDENKLEEKKREIKKAGASNFHVLTDFDRTLTKAFVHGSKVNTSYAHLRNNDYLGEDYAKKAHALFQKYFPIEMSTELSREEKAVEMQHWWEEHHALLIEKGLTDEMLSSVAQREDLLLRQGVLDFLSFLSERHVPVVIMSAGMGNVIDFKLQKEHAKTKNVHILSNRFTFAANGEVNGKEGPIIHSMNKHEIALHGQPFFHELEKRKNVLLLGDTVEDIGMVDGFGYENLIAIGFLNKDDPHLLEKFEQVYDIVIPKDGSAQPVVDLLYELFG